MADFTAIYEQNLQIRSVTCHLSLTLSTKCRFVEDNTSFGTWRHEQIPRCRCSLRLHNLQINPKTSNHYKTLHDDNSLYEINQLYVMILVINMVTSSAVLFIGHEVQWWHCNTLVHAKSNTSFSQILTVTWQHIQCCYKRVHSLNSVSIFCCPT